MAESTLTGLEPVTFQRSILPSYLSSNFNNFSCNPTHYQMIALAFTSPDVCFCTTWGNRTGDICIEMNRKTFNKFHLTISVDCLSSSRRSDSNSNIVVVIVILPSVPRKHPDVFDCNLKTKYQILIIFDTNIPDATCHQMIIQFSISPNVCFCTTWGEHNQ